MKSVRIQSLSGRYFPALGQNTDQKNYEYGHFSRSDGRCLFTIISFREGFNIWYLNVIFSLIQWFQSFKSLGNPKQTIEMLLLCQVKTFFSFQYLKVTGINHNPRQQNNFFMNYFDSGRFKSCFVYHWKKTELCFPYR